jgi:mannose/fructose-specific phosphotransferase system component IIA
LVRARKRNGRSTLTTHILHNATNKVVTALIVEAYPVVIGVDLAATHNHKRTTNLNTSGCSIIAGCNLAVVNNMVKSRPVNESAKRNEICDRTVTYTKEKGIIVATHTSKSGGFTVNVYALNVSPSSVINNNGGISTVVPN